MVVAHDYPHPCQEVIDITMDIDKLIEQINLNFKPPFVEEGLVKAWRGIKGDFCLRIGKRDIQLYENGDFMGAGTCLLEDDQIALDAEVDRGRGK
ncbi:hypothetical protein LCGC14_0338200 [marine sediment metagenome]|uniref:Uncharacterized protein n=1 Tax=marine sediment metagenome TaxID=412755 RepID=A0A0F9W1R3_9ZZZZ